MDRISNAVSIVVKTIVVLSLVLLLTFDISANRRQRASVPRFVGSPESQSRAFNRFMVRNIGRRVYLEVSFAEEPIGYRSGNADPFFGAANYTYFFECGEAQESLWMIRCASLNYNPARKTFVGYFVIREPNPRRMRTNRMFTLTPSN